LTKIVPVVDGTREARHRIIQVQLAAGKALKAWKGEPSEDSPPKSRGLAVFLVL